MGIGTRVSDMLFSTDIHILVTSDVDTVRLVITHLLRQLGYWKISEASNTDMALRSFRNAMSVRSPIDFLISGLCSDDDASIKLITSVREINVLAKTPILLVTKQATKKIIAEAAHAGADACLVTPIRAIRLQQKIDELSRKYRSVSNTGRPLGQAPKGHSMDMLDVA